MSDEISLPKIPDSAPPFLQGIASQIGIFGGLVTWHVAAQQDRYNKELSKFCEDVLVRVSELDKLENIDSKHFWSEKYFDTFRDLGSQYSQETDLELKSYLKKFMINYAIHGHLDISVIAIMRGFLRQISGTHCLVLNIFFEKQKNIKAQDREYILKSKDAPELVNQKELFKKTNMEYDLISFILSDLIRHNLINSIETESFGIESKKFLLTPIGSRFLHFIRD